MWGHVQQHEVPTGAAALRARCRPQVLNSCYELLAACVRGAEDVSPEMKARCLAGALLGGWPPLLSACLAFGGGGNGVVG